jgi:hypothetical protein
MMVGRYRGPMAVGRRFRGPALVAAVLGAAGALATGPAPVPASGAPVAAGVELAAGRFAGTAWRLSAEGGPARSLCLGYEAPIPHVRQCAFLGTAQDPGPGLWGHGAIGDIANGDSYAFGLVNARSRSVRITLKARPGVPGR